MPEHKKPGPGRQQRASAGPPGSNRQGQGKATPRPKPRPAKPNATPVEPASTEPVELTQPSLEPPEYVVIAQVSSPFGLRGAVKATIQTDFPERFERLEEVFLSPPGAAPKAERERYGLVSARIQNLKQVVLRFEGITKVEQADTLRGYSVAVPVAEVVPLPEGEYYIFQIVGLEVYSTEGQYIGRLVNVETLPANDIYIVRGPLSAKDVLIPAIKDVVKEIDLEAGRITIELMEGLLPEG